MIYADVFNPLCRRLEVAVHARGEPTLAFWDGLLFLHRSFFPESEMELLKKECEVTFVYQSNIPIS